tara:strand:- start:657 stop:1838 length:1182 start_codon:yes stop_codon:yes gene_type:complete
MATALSNIGQDRRVQPWEGTLSEYNLNPGWDWFLPGKLTEKLFFEEETPPIEAAPAAVAPVVPTPLGTPSQEIFQDDGDTHTPPAGDPKSKPAPLGTPRTPGLAVGSQPWDSPKPDKPDIPEEPFDPFDVINNPPSWDDVVDVITPDFAIGIGNKEFDEFGTRSYGGRDIDLAELGKSAIDKAPDAIGFVVGQGLNKVPLAGAGTTFILDLATGKHDKPSTWGKLSGSILGAPLGPFISGALGYIGGNLGEQYEIDSTLGRGAGFWSSLGNALGFKSDTDYIRDIYGLSNEDITGKIPSPMDRLPFDKADRATGKVWGPGSIVVPVDVPHVGRDGPDYDALNLGYQTQYGLDGMARGPGFDQYGPPSEDWNDPDDPDAPGHNEEDDGEMSNDW